MNDAKGLYRAMMLTTEYADFTTAKNTFVNGLNSNNVNFGSKSEWMTWIQSNLSSTSFTSVAQFETRLDNLIDKLSILMAANTALYRFIAQADAKQKVLIMEAELDDVPIVEYPVVPTTCVEDCQNAYEAAYDALDAEVEEAIDSMTGDDSIWKQIELTLILTSLEEKRIDLALEYNACANPCTS